MENVIGFSKTEGERKERVERKGDGVREREREREREGERGIKPNTGGYISPEKN